MNRILIGIAIAALVAALGMGWVAKTQYDDARYLRTENKAFKEAADRALVREERDRKIIAASQNKIALQARRWAETRAALAEALQRNKEWSDTHVPDDVQKALGGGSGGPATGLLDR